MPTRQTSTGWSALLIGIVTVLLVAGLIGYYFFLIPVARRQHGDDTQGSLHGVILTVRKYHDANKELPTGNFYQDDIALEVEDQDVLRFSWRVEILPYMGQQAIYRRFRFDEPWDSEHNLEAAQLMPHIYRGPGNHSRNHTSIVAIADKDGAFPISTLRADRNDKRRLSDFTDGLDTIALVQVKDSGIIWTDPRDLSLDEFIQLVKDGRVAHPGTAHVTDDNVMVALMDGSIFLLPRSVSAHTVRALCTYAGGENVAPHTLP